MPYTCTLRAHHATLPARARMRTHARTRTRLVRDTRTRCTTHRRTDGGLDTRFPHTHTLPPRTCRAHTHAPFTTFYRTHARCGWIVLVAWINISLVDRISPQTWWFGLLSIVRIWDHCVIVLHTHLYLYALHARTHRLPRHRLHTAHRARTRTARTRIPRIAARCCRGRFTTTTCRTHRHTTLCRARARTACHAHHAFSHGLTKAAEAFGRRRGFPCMPVWRCGVPVHTACLVERLDADIDSLFERYKPKYLIIFPRAYQIITFAQKDGSA